jgi:putative phage-type endonuclease
MQQRTEEWFEQRKKLLTGSRVAAAIGKSKYTSRQKLWRQYMGLEPEVERSEAMLYGVENEPIAIAEYECKTGVFVDPAPLVVHPIVTWLAASPDGYIGSDGLLEVKCRFNGIPHEEVPDEYMIQIQVQLACTGRKWVDFWSWSETREPFLKRVEYDHDAFEEIMAGAREFWHYVITKQEPPRMKRKSKEK